MRGLALATWVGIVAVLCSLLGTLWATPALAASSDAATTETYLRANYQLVSTGHRLSPTARSRIRALRDRLRTECAGLVEGSPQNEQSGALTWELIGAMTITGYSAGASAANKFARTVSRLHWSSKALTNAVHTYARQGLAEIRTPLPDVCADLRAWKASGYTTLPPTTVRFRKEFYENYVGVGFLPKRQLSPYLRPSQSSLLRRTRRLEYAIAEVEAFEVETFAEIMDSLGLNQ
jgi:hypothetical protein